MNERRRGKQKRGGNGKEKQEINRRKWKKSKRVREICRKTEAGYITAAIVPVIVLLWSRTTELSVSKCFKPRGAIRRAHRTI